MKSLFTVFVTIFCSFLIKVNCQTTYTWNAARGDWATAANWTPTRTTPAANDILVFNGSVTANACVTNIPLQTIGKLRIINNINVRFVPGNRVNGTGTISRSGTAVTGTGTLFTTELKVGEIIYSGTTYRGDVVSIASNTSLTTTAAGTIASTAYTYPIGITVNDGTTSAIDIQAGTVLTIGDNGAEPMTLYIAAGSKGQNSGTIRFLYNRQRIIALDSAAFNCKNGSLVVTDSSFAGNCFGAAGIENTTIFENGASYQYYAGANPFGLSQPASKVVFVKGSNFIQAGSTSPAVSGRSFGTFTHNFSGAAVTATQGNTGYIDSLVVLQGQLNFSSTGTTTIGNIVNPAGTLNMNISGGNTNITGNINIGASGKINLNGKFTTTPANVSFTGTAQQKISGTGNLRISVTSDSIVFIRIQNKTGVLLERAVELNASILAMDSGYITLNNNTLTIGSNTLQGRATQLNGYITGAGIISRWYATTNTGAGDSSLFPVGSAGDKYPLWVSGLPTTGGTVNFTSFAGNPTTTVFSSPFYDTATTAGVIVNKRLNHSWTLSTANGLAGNMNVRVSSPVPSGFVTDVTGMRVTLSNGIAPGTLSEDGSGTLTQPVAGKTGLTAAQLNNTFYLGTNSTINPLPLAFVSISGTQAANSNIISWATAQEVNVSSFEIEKSVDNKTFFAIGTLKALNTRSANNYSFEDLQGGDAFYRIKAIDYSGEVSYSKSIYLNRTKIPDAITVYPNPAQQYVTLSDLSLVEKGSIKLINSLGKELKIIITDKGIDVNELATGIYYLHATTNGSTQVLKFVKQ